MNIDDQTAATLNRYLTLAEKSARTAREYLAMAHETAMIAKAPKIELAGRIGNLNGHVPSQAAEAQMQANRFASTALMEMNNLLIVAAQVRQVMGGGGKPENNGEPVNFPP